MTPTKLLTLHALAKTYGRLPSEIYSLDYDEYMICVDAFKEGCKAEKREMEKAKRRKK